MSQSSLHVQIQKRGDETEVTFSGVLDEFAKLPELENEGGRIRIDLSKVKMMNSEGTRLWCLWVQRFKPPGQVILEGCSFHFVRAFNVMKGFLPATFRVDSFVVPFFSEATGENVELQAVRGKHFDETGKMHFDEIKDSQGNPMELDVVPSTYFAFLKN
jgi:hypothetical protein